MAFPARLMPGWPARMQAPLAAAYLGISRTKFVKGAGGRYPAPVRDGGNVVWHRRDLDDWLERDRLNVEGSRLDPFDEALEHVGEAGERP